MLKLKLHLVWLSCVDFESLGHNKNRLHIIQAWEDIKSKMEFYLRGYEVSLQSIKDCFGNIRLTKNPNQVACYDPKLDVLVLNLWALFFHPIENDFCSPAHTLRTCQTLVHEYDHRCYFRDHKMIGKTDEEYDEFGKLNCTQIERRAHLSQIEFLKYCRQRSLPHMTDYEIRIKEWTDKGEPLDYSVKPFPINREVAYTLIDAMINDSNSVLEQIETGEDYDQIASISSYDSFLRMISILSLPTKIEPTERQYPFIEIKM